MSKLAYFSIGWDVGGWNCDKNQRSRDAIVILNPDLRARYPTFDHQDKEDALICALIAALFAGQRETLWRPPDDTPLSEGWIWVPRDATNRGK